MNSLIEILNAGGDCALRFAWSMLWQSSLLIGLLFALEWLWHRKVRAAVRYALWLVVLAKLLLPPSLALPTGLGWWLRPAPAASRTQALPVVVSYGPERALSLPAETPTASMPPARPPLSVAALGLLGASLISLGLLGWMLWRWREVARETQAAGLAPEWLEALLAESRRAAGVRRRVRLRLTDQPVSPAVCGLLRPTILLPRLLSEQLPPAQLRAVLLHELVHLRRGDVWVNCAQALLQLVYWWHPLLWLANARIRRVREEAVDDAVVEALGGEAESYAPTLLEVAKLALQRPLASLGLVGILESHSSLRQRIERLLDFHPPRQAGLTLGSALWVLAFGALAVPMGERPAATTPGEPDKTTASAPPSVSEDATNRPAATNSPGLTNLQEAVAKAIQRDREKASEVQTPGITSTNRGPFPLKDRDIRANVVRPSAGVQALYGKLDRIRLPEVVFAGAPLEEVVRWLADGTRKRDPEGKGVNFIIVAGGRTEPGATDSATGLPIPPTAAEMKDIQTIPIKIASPLRDVRVTDVLEAICEAAGNRINYTVQDYGVVFSAKTGKESPPLYVRTYKVDPNTLLAGLRTRGSQAKAGDAKGISQALRDFFTRAGVDLAPPKSVFFNDRQGALMVRATLQDLDSIEKSVQELKVAPPQINIKAEFIEIPEESLTNFWQSLSLAASVPTNESRMLTPAQTAAALKKVNSTHGCDLVNEASVTTLSGRQTQIQVVDLSTIVTGINPRALQPPGISTSSNGPPPSTLNIKARPLQTLLVSTGSNSADGLYLAQPLPFGPCLDLVPQVVSNGWAVQLTAIPTLTEFLGYGKPTNSVPVYVNGRKQQVTRPLPHFRVHSLTNSATIGDGHTLVLDGLTSESIIKLKDGVPLLGDLPLVGKLFRSESSSVTKKRMLVFITPTLIDPVGNRIHREDEVPPPAAK